LGTVRSSGKGQIVQRVFVSSQQGLALPHFFAPAVRELRHKKENCRPKFRNLGKNVKILWQKMSA